LVSFAQHEGKEGFLKTAAKNWTGKHGLAILGATTALGAIGGIVRYSRAVKHNEWSDRHYAFLEQQQAEKAAGFAAKTEAERDSGSANKSR
jgi:hypothetical protein